MNLFMVGWNLPQEMCSTIPAELRQMVEVYPQLDPTTLWQRTVGGVAFAASMHTATKVAAPRRYVWQGQAQVTLYEGSVIDPTGGFTANDAEGLSSHWQQLPDKLEGQYVVIRMTEDPPSIELLTDILGMEQVYYLHWQDMWLVSNSVHLIARVTHSHTLDPLGVSLFLTMGWVGADRTLQHGIYVIPGGQHWVWRSGSRVPHRACYYPRANLSRRPKEPLTRLYIEQLAHKLVKTCDYLAHDYDDLRCPLTGGRDSRVLASLLVHRGMKAQYYTSGHLLSADVQIGTRIAEACNLTHSIDVQTTEDVIRGWQEARQRLIRQNDGLVSLWQIADVLQQPSHIDHLCMSLWGIGGEIARGFYSEPKALLFQYNLQGIQHLLSRRLIKNYGQLIRQEAISSAQSYLQQFIEEAFGEGFISQDIPDLFYTYERVRRWGGSNARKSRPLGDRFSIFCCRPFVEAAFAMPAQYRYSEPLHYELIRLLAPALHGFPFEKEPWRSQVPLMNIALALVKRPALRVYRGVRRRFLHKPLKAGTPLPTWDHAAWFEALCPQIRAFCLDQEQSVLWDIIDRSVFERVMSSTANAAERSGRTAGLCNVATLFYYTSSCSSESAI